MNYNYNYKRYLKYIKKNGGGKILNIVENILLNQDDNRVLCKNQKIFDIQNITHAEQRGNNFFVNDELFIFQRRIAFGAYGSVCEYKNEKNEYIIIKLSKNDDEEDLKQDIVILNYMKHNNICDNIYVKSYIVSKSAIIMDYMDDNLEKCVNLPINQKILIFEEVVKHIYCLEKANLYYTDIKLQNILYKCNNDGSINIILGDIGSIVNGNVLKLKYGGIATYPPPEFNDGLVRLNRNINFRITFNRSIVWSLGITFLVLFGINKLKYFYDWKHDKIPLKMQVSEIPRDINMVHNILDRGIEYPEHLQKNSDLIFIIHNILSIDPEERMSLDELYVRIKNNYVVSDDIIRNDSDIYTEAPPVAQSAAPPVAQSTAPPVAQSTALHTIEQNRDSSSSWYSHAKTESNLSSFEFTL
jgi:serine/threonine protein kinase